MTTKKPTPIPPPKPKEDKGRWVTENGTTYWKGPKPKPVNKRGSVDDSGNPIYIIDKKTGKRKQATYGELGPNTKRVK
tara:strand:- start:260 stop:493 length:234 start_codon:yes stop_codon:yes gene_type:complete